MDPRLEAEVCGEITDGRTQREREQERADRQFN